MPWKIDKDWMLKINKFFTSTKGVKFLSFLGPVFFTRRNVDEVKSQRDGASLSNYNPLVFIAKSSFHDCSTYDRLKKKKCRHSFIVPYIWISSAINIKKMSSLEQFSHLNMKKCLCLPHDLGNWRTNLTMVFELMISLCIEICSNFVTFNI